MRNKERLNNWTKDPNLQVGDLVYHLLYGKEWIGIVMSIGEDGKVEKDKKRVLVRMVPGTEFSGFFGSRPSVLKVGPNSGWVTDYWLVKFNNLS